MKLTAVSLYSGAGGLDVGLTFAGFSIQVGIEKNATAAATLRANWDHPVLDRDIEQVGSKELLSIAGLREGDVDLVAGGPPCQPFSKSAYWANGDTRRLDDDRASTLEAFLRVVRDVKPRAFLIENVPGLGYRGKDEGLDLLRTRVDDINKEAGTDYQLNVAPRIDAADHGVPQHRRRLFVVAHREGGAFTFPPVSFAGGDRQVSQDLAGIDPFRNAWDAIGDLEEDDDPALALSGKWAGLLPSIPEGGNYLYHTDRGDGEPIFGWRTRYWSFLLKLAKRLPSWTVTAQPGSATGPFHWKNRRLSKREMCRLQCFPDDYRILGNLTSAQRQLGNAVPCALAETLGREIRTQLLDSAANGADRSELIPERRLPIPPQELASPVPPAYQELAGDHQAHPGVGLGPRARAREEASKAG